MVSDSSMKGYGVYLGQDWMAGSWNQSNVELSNSSCGHIGPPPVMESSNIDFSNINILELWPIVVGLKRWAHLLKNKSLNLFTDNTQVMFMLLKGSSSNPIFLSWIKEIYWICVINNIELKPKYINTRNNLVADTLSRLLYFKSVVDV